MKVVLYARVSTRDKGQDPETQLRVLRAEADRLGYEVYQEYIDKASALDTAHRHQWRQLLTDARARKFQVVMVYKLDRAFRSMIDIHLTLAEFDNIGILFKSYADPGIDMTTAFGRMVLNIVGTFAEFERDIIRERIKTGVDRVRATGKTKSGRPIGRPRCNYPVENIVYIYRSLPEGRGRLAETARRVGVNIGSCRNRLIEAGVI